MELIGQKKNYDYIDASKGVLMIWVVFTHISYFIFHDPDNIVRLTGDMIRMPLFFVFSGFLSYSAVYTHEIFSKRVKNRIYRQLWPTLCIFVVHTAFLMAHKYSSGGGYDVLVYEIKMLSRGYYWFTIVLFEIFVVFAVCSRFIYKHNLPKISYVLLLFFFIALRLIYILSEIPFIIPAAFSEAVNLTNILMYLPFFFVGVVIRAYYNKVEQYAPAKWYVGALVISAIILGSVIMVTKVSAHYVQYLCTFIFVPIIVFGICSLRTSVTEGQRISHTLKCIGKRTLPVYLLHYFLVDILIIMDLHIASLFNNPILENIAILLISLFFVYLCVAFDNMMKKYTPSVHKFIYSPLELRRASSVKTVAAE